MPPTPRRPRPCLPCRRVPQHGRRYADEHPDHERNRRAVRRRDTPSRLYARQRRHARADAQRRERRPEIPRDDARPLVLRAEHAQRGAHQRMQRLQGEVVISDITRTHWADSYRASPRRARRRSPASRPPSLDLTATDPDNVYPTIARVTPDTDVPVRAQFFLASGLLFRSADFSAPVDANGRKVIRKITYRNEIESSARASSTSSTASRARFRRAGSTPTRLPMVSDHAAHVDAHRDRRLPSSGRLWPAAALVPACAWLHARARRIADGTVEHAERHRVRTHRRQHGRARAARAT